MPIKKTPNVLNFDFRSDQAVMSIFTMSKKAHFTCSDSKLFEALEYSINDNYGFFQVHLTTFPFVAVHVTGNPEKLEAEGPKIRAAIEETLAANHDVGKVKI